MGSKLLDASVLIIPLVGFLKPDDARVKGTVEAIRKHLVRDGFVVRYDTGKTEDGLPPGEGAFLPCTFWLADNLALGRPDRRCSRASSTGSWDCGTTWVCCPRNTIRDRSGSWAISRRHFPTLASSTRP